VANVGPQRQKERVCYKVRSINIGSPLAWPASNPALAVNWKPLSRQKFSVNEHKVKCSQMKPKPVVALYPVVADTHRHRQPYFEGHRDNEFVYLLLGCILKWIILYHTYFP
jgi:hypothetical protein